MATLTKDAPRTYVTGDRNALPMAANTTIYEGAAVGVVAASGQVRPLVAGDRFAGFAECKHDNSKGAAGDVNVRVKKTGCVALTVAGVAATSVGAKVYASDDATFTLTATSNSLIGTVTRFVGNGVAEVGFDADRVAIVS